MDKVGQIAKMSALSRLPKAGERGASRLIKVAPQASHVPKPNTIGLSIGQPDDHFEQEANQMADRVMSGRHRPDSVSPANRVHSLQTKSQSHRMTVAPSLLEEDKRLQLKPATGSHTGHRVHHLPATFSTRLHAASSGGQTLEPKAARFMEDAFHADFSRVRVHTDAPAAIMSQQLGAHAFTHKNHIFFNSQKYNPSSQEGKHLLAHELTHVVQQGYAGKAASTSQSVQPSWLSSLENAIDSAEEFISDTLEAGLHKFLEKVSGVIQQVPGYKALRVVLGHDPITREEVPFNGHNFIEAGLDLMPFGTQIGDKLREMGALAEAEKWVDTQISAAKSMISGVANSISTFISSISLASLAHPGELIQRAGELIANGIKAVTDFAVNAASELVNIIKKFLLKVLVDFVKNQTRFYPLLSVILGHDPITGEEVARNGTNILTAFLLISEDGEAQKKEMVESGTFQKAVKWIDTGIAVFSGAYAEIVAGFHSIWDNASIQYLIHPIDTFKTIYRTFEPPVARVVSFVASAALAILKFIKEALKKKIAIEARIHQGYPLLTVLLGEDPFTGEAVPRNVENLIHGFMRLMDGGEEQFAQMKESGAIARASQRVNAAVDALNMTKDYIVGLFTGLWNSFSIKDLIHPFEAFARVVGTLLGPIRRLIAFVIEIVRIAVRVILEIMQFPFSLIDSIMSKVMEAFDTIKKNPVAFLKNILKAIKEGFSLFFGNITRHLLDGLKAWLSSELKDAGVKAPTDFTFKGILSWVLDTLNITMDAILKKLEKKIGPEKMAKIRSMLHVLDGAWSFIKDVQERGLIAIWERIKEKLSNLWDTVLDFIKSWMVQNIIEKVTAKLLSMLDPSGIMAVVNSTIAIYKAIQSAIQYMRRMLEILNTFVSGILQIAKGDIKTAAGFLENALAQGVPVMIGFLANQVGLGGIGKKVGEMVEKVREKIDAALQWIVDKAWAVGGPLLMKLIDLALSVGDKISTAWDKAKAMVKAGVDKVKGVGRGLLNLISKKTFTLGSVNHTLTAKDKDGKLEVMMASKESLYESKIRNAIEIDIPQIKIGKSPAELKKIRKIEEVLSRALIRINQIRADYESQLALSKKPEADFQKFINTNLVLIINDLKPLGDPTKNPYSIPSLDLVLKITNRKIPKGFDVRAKLYEKQGPKSAFDGLSDVARRNYVEDLWFNAPAGLSLNVNDINKIVSATPPVPVNIQQANQEWNKYRSLKLIPAKDGRFASPVEFRKNLLQFRAWKDAYAYDHKINLGELWIKGDRNVDDSMRQVNYLNTGNLVVITQEENSKKAVATDRKFGENPIVGSDFSSKANDCPKGSLFIAGQEFENGDL